MEGLSSVVGNSSVYMNRSIQLNVEGMISCTVMDDTVASAMDPKSSALKTGERAARMARFARNVLPSTVNDTSVPYV